jgi:hypothetical protein
MFTTIFDSKKLKWRREIICWTQNNQRVCGWPSVGTEIPESLAFVCVEMVIFLLAEIRCLLEKYSMEWYQRLWKECLVELK